VLYEIFSAKIGEAKGAAQMLLEPFVVTLSYREVQLFHSCRDLFESVGLIGEEFGDGTLILRALPAVIAAGEEEIFFREILEHLISLPHRPPREVLVHHLASSAACKAAVKSGERLKQEEAAALLKQLRLTSNPYTCPHGRPTTITLSHQDLTARFRRGR
jgi:DNA mismatch repair protein MutL